MVGDSCDVVRGSEGAIDYMSQNLFYTFVFTGCGKQEPLLP